MTHVLPTQSWAEAQLRALDDDVERSPPPVFSLSFLWLDKNIAVAADQVFNGVRMGRIWRAWWGSCMRTPSSM